MRMPQNYTFICNDNRIYVDFRVIDFLLNVHFNSLVWTKNFFQILRSRHDNPLKPLNQTSYLSFDPNGNSELVYNQFNFGANVCFFLQNCFKIAVDNSNLLYAVLC